MNDSSLKRYPLTVRILHWLHTIAFVILAVTGIMLAATGDVPHTSLASFHNAIGHFWVALPVVFLIIRPRTSFRGLKALCRWGRDDVAWLRAAPRYYFRNDASGMSRDSLRAGQKVWWLVTFLTWLVISVTGLIKEVFVNHGLSPSAVHAMTYLHDIAFGVVGAFFLLHIYMVLFRRKSLRSMVAG